MLGDIKTEYVDCTVECVKVYLPLSCPRSALNFSYRMAIMVLDNLASTSCISQHVHRRVILERFVGPFDALDAPEWTSWARPMLEFQQPKATFVTLFLRMATWDENKNEVRLQIAFAEYPPLTSFSAWTPLSHGPVGSLNDGEPSTLKFSDFFLSVLMHEFLGCCRGTCKTVPPSDSNFQQCTIGAEHPHS
jgi:hypothetical protein